MIDKATFETLIQMQESSELDFKYDMFDLSKDDKEYSRTSDLAKDILSFINTIRVNTSYIICGIKSSNGVNTLHGITKGFDDAHIQQKIKDKIYPTPKFETYIFEYKGMNFGVLEFPVITYETFLTSTIDMKSVKAGTLYYRQGSSNSIADARKVIEIEKWIKNNKPVSNQNLNDIVKGFLHQINNDNNSLTAIIIDIQHFAIQYGFKELLDFCESELKGYTISSSHPERRLINQYYVRGHYPNTLLYDYDDIKKQLNAKQLPLFQPMNIKEVEDEIKSYTFSIRKKEWKFVDSNINDSLLKSFSSDENFDISKIYTLNIYKDLYKQVKSYLMEFLFNINKSHS